jgi:hypothetical protein
LAALRVIAIALGGSGSLAGQTPTLAAIEPRSKTQE